MLKDNNNLLNHQLNGKFNFKIIKFVNYFNCVKFLRSRSADPSLVVSPKKVQSAPVAIQVQPQPQQQQPQQQQPQSQQPQPQQQQPLQQQPQQQKQSSDEFKLLHNLHVLRQVNNLASAQVRRQLQWDETETLTSSKTSSDLVDQK